jgi:polysaccharide deacetylase family protein (PEP-CTERM system associated)
MNNIPATCLEKQNSLFEDSGGPPTAKWRADPVQPPYTKPLNIPGAQIILSFDVEEHYRIEAAASLAIDSRLKAHYRERLDLSTNWLLDELGQRQIKATFFVVGQVAKHLPALVRAIQKGGHEVASHSWDHQRVHRFTPKTFREDVRLSKDALEQVTGEEVIGYRAPTFSIVRQTAWALDVLAELGLVYDSSIFPVWHDRYGVPGAPRGPFLARGKQHQILELPPATLRFLGTSIPVGGGGYFRLLPLFVMKHALRQVRRACHPPVAMLYFHPWEFDPDQARLPFKRLNHYRTYVGLNSSREKLIRLLGHCAFVRARDTASWLLRGHSLERYEIAGGS